MFQRHFASLLSLSLTTHASESRHRPDSGRQSEVWLQDGFRTSGLHPVDHPVDRDEVLKKLPSAPVNCERAVSAGLRNRGAETNLSADAEGRKVVPGRRLVVDAATGPVESTSTAPISVASTSIAPVSVAYAGPVASSSTMNAYVAPTWASKRAKVTVETADICAVCKDWNSPDPDAESEDARIDWPEGDVFRMQLLGQLPPLPVPLHLSQSANGTRSG